MELHKHKELKQLTLVLVFWPSILNEYVEEVWEIRVYGVPWTDSEYQQFMGTVINIPDAIS